MHIHRSGTSAKTVVEWRKLYQVAPWRFQSPTPLRHLNMYSPLIVFSTPYIFSFNDLPHLTRSSSSSGVQSQNNTYNHPLQFTQSHNHTQPPDPNPSLTWTPRNLQSVTRFQTFKFKLKTKILHSLYDSLSILSPLKIFAI